MTKERMVALVLILAILALWGCGARQQPVPESTQPPASLAEPVPEPTQPPPSLAEPDGQVLVVTASLLNLRICPSMECQIIAVLPKGQEVVKLGAEAGWLRVRVPAMQKEGWVGACYVRIVGSKPVMSPPPPPLPPPEMKEEWTTPDKQTAPVKEEQTTQDNLEAPQVKEEWAPLEKEETTGLNEEGTSSRDQTLPEVKEEFAK